ncbi:hypothetical protein RKE38_06460 [Phycicoccus sp. M110.8]|uniref:hypothetical protein n=1 Tax=Phycicoccus sp. M110.8 TaxID=3075433 RepID=UPI0028FDA681|nr:hypothetical protein [Phycicoccus sp. M110.8]MDU0313325.1 hypothetical protein [Phycicoccus sp. M110.8]
MSIETQLREALTARADDVAPTVEDPWSRVDGAIRTSARRRRAAYAGVTAAVVAVAVLVPGLVGGGHRATTPATHTAPVVPGPQDPRWRALSTWPTRGWLSGDAAFLRAVEQRTGAHVLYAGDVGERRVVVTWNEQDTGSGLGTTYLLSGPRDSAVDRLAQVAEAPPSAATVVTVLAGQSTGATLLALATPGHGSMEVSPTVRIEPDATVTRSWSTARLDRDGTAKVSLPTVAPYATRVRLAGSDGAPTLVDPGEPQAADPASSICVNCPVAELRTKAPRAISRTIGLSLGLDPARITTREVYAGPVDLGVAAAAGLTDARSRGFDVLLYVATSELPGGGVLRTALLVSTAKDGSSAQTTELESGVPVDAATADRRPVVISGPDLKGSDTMIEVFAPGSARVALVSDAPTIFPGTAPKAVADGSASFRVSGTGGTDHLRVATYDAIGRETGRWPLRSPNADDPYDVRP